MELCECPGGGEIIRRGAADELELPLGLVKPVERDQRAAHRHACGNVSGIARQAGVADRDGFLQPAGATELLGELGESNRRRILAEAASKIFDARVV